MTQHFHNFLGGISFLLFFSLAAQAQTPQEELTGLPSRPASTEIKANYKKSAASLSLPFFDDFSYNKQKPDNQLWEDDQVYISQTMPNSPPTLGAAVFDGLNRFGLAYDINNLDQDTTDVLTSQPIDLSSPTDSVYLSFFWQSGGKGEHPESSDSLQVQFYSPLVNEWIYAWSMTGKDSSEFNQVLLPVDDVFHQDGFQFRFRSFGAPAGAFDTWLVDYVRLDDQRSFTDTAFTDIAFTRPHPSLLQNYSAIPFFHADPTSLNFLFKDQLKLYYQRNLRPNNTLNPNLGVFQISLNGQVLDEDLQGDITLDPVKANNVESTYSYPINLSVNSVPSAEFSVNAFSTYNLAGPNRSSNDTVRFSQVFSNYYAYDDGTAERAYQVGDNGGGVIISKYELLDISDDIMGLYLYFFPAEYDVADNEFSIVIYDEDPNGRPGNLIYETDSVYTPRYSETNYFLPYALDSAVSVNGNVFMGIRQLKSKRLPIGFDRNNTNRTTVFFGQPGGNIFESFAEGTLMMRPYLRYQPADLNEEEIPVVSEKIALAVFPNPARDHVRIYFTDDQKNFRYRIIDLGGRVLQEGIISEEISFNNSIQRGAYILRIEDPSGSKSPFTTKLLITR